MCLYCSLLLFFGLYSNGAHTKTINDYEKHLMFVLVTVQSKKTVIKKLHVRIVISLLKCNKNELFKKSQDEFTSAKKLTSVESFDSKRRPTK